MKKFLEQKKSAIVSGMSNNKGFSLVELIVVVAIMAVLMGVLAPQYLRFVESSREQTDATAANGIGEAITLAISMMEQVPEATTVTWATSATTDYVIAADGTAELTAALQKELDATLGANGSNVGAAASGNGRAGDVVFTVAREPGTSVAYVYVTGDFGDDKWGDVINMDTVARTTV